MYQVFIETTAKAKQQAEEIGLGQETHEMDMRPVEIFGVICPNLRCCSTVSFSDKKRGTLFWSVRAWVPPRSRRRSSDGALLVGDIRLGIYSPSLSMSQPLSS